ncbi:MAG: hypothetical protein AAGE76_15600 [Pseudomonadota bacterium]
MAVDHAASCIYRICLPLNTAKDLQRRAWESGHSNEDFCTELVIIVAQRSAEVEAIGSKNSDDGQCLTSALTGSNRVIC